MQPLNDQFKEVCGFPDHSTLDTLNIHSHSLNCCGDTFWCLGWGECKEESSSMFIMAYQLITICSGLESVAYIEATWWIFEWMNELLIVRWDELNAMVGITQSEVFFCRMDWMVWLKKFDMLLSRAWLVSHENQIVLLMSDEFINIRGPYCW